MVNSTDHLLEVVTRERLLAIVRGGDSDAALRTTIALAEEGFAAIEVSLTTADALGVIAKVAVELTGHVRLGAGTVVHPGQVDAAVTAGADFVVTPGWCAAVDVAASRGLPTIVGALTPSEVIRADRAGATAIKVFPASLGGPHHVAALRQPFPDTRFIPVGGVAADDVAGYLAAGATAVGVGGPLVGDAADGGDLAALRRRARTFRATHIEV